MHEHEANVRIWREPVRFILVWTVACLLPVVGLVGSAVQPAPPGCFEYCGLGQTIAEALIPVIVVVWLAVSGLAVWLWSRANRARCAVCEVAMSRYVWTSLAPTGTDAQPFPNDLAGAIGSDVLDGRLPAAAVVHLVDGEWEVLAAPDSADGGSAPADRADAVHPARRPNVIAHMRHAVERDPSLASMSGLSPGLRADRARGEDTWQIGPIDVP